MRIYDIIQQKRDGYRNTHEQLETLINGYIEGKIPDYQVSAWLMAVYFNHLSPEERADLTEIMLNSGDKIILDSLSGFKVDKHSTGGVGDKVTLVVGPIVAAAGLKFAKLSGRGLGHTGGTIDKLEAIPGFKTSLDVKKFLSIVESNGIAIAGQTAKVAPADKKLYALRDVTATVDEISLIASSIMSKKLSIETDGIVLDVKTGSGAFMKTTEGAFELAEAMIDIGRRHGRKMSAVISDMNQPLGRMVGNALEVREALDTLKGKGPEDFSVLCKVIAKKMIVLSGIEETEAERKIENIILTGEALNIFGKMISAQGGNGDVINNPDAILPQAKFKLTVKSPSKGFVKSIDTEKIGIASMLLGAGRQKKEDIIDPAVGIEVIKKIGDNVIIDEPLAVIYTNNDELAIEAGKLITESYELTKDSVIPPPIIHKLY